MRYLFLPFLFIASSCFAQKLKPISTYLGNPKLSKEARKFYKNLPLYQKNPAKYYNDPQVELMTSSIQDSVLSSNKQLAPFYLYLMNRNLGLTDGELYSIALTKQYRIMEMDPVLFFQYMADNPTEKKLYFEKWVNMMLQGAQLYCPQYKGLETDSCLNIIRNNAMLKLATKNAAANKLGQEFFRMLVNVPDDLPLVLTKEDHGKAFNIRNDKVVKITLHECRGCASVWHIVNEDLQKVEVIDTAFTNPSCKNCVGGNHDRNIYFKLKNKGKTVLNFDYFEQKLSITFIVD